MPNGVSRYARIVIDPFHFRGVHGRASRCALEVLPVTDGRTPRHRDRTTGQPRHVGY